MSKLSDKNLSRGLILISTGILVYWLLEATRRAYAWFSGLTSPSTGWWPLIGSFCLDNIGILIVVYLVICLQVAGFIEFKLKKNFLKAFLWSIAITPPVTLIIWGHRKQTE